MNFYLPSWKDTESGIHWHAIVNRRSNDFASEHHQGFQQEVMGSHERQGEQKEYLGFRRLHPVEELGFED